MEGWKFTAPEVETVDNSLEFQPLTNINTLLFSSPTNSTIIATTIDPNNNVYLIGSFIGSMDNVASEDRDIFVAKLSAKGALLWKIHLHSNLNEVNSATGDDRGLDIFWSQQDQAIYIAGHTNSSLVETNSSGNPDIFWGKISTSGQIQWLKQLGQESIANLSLTAGMTLDSTQLERFQSLNQLSTGEIVIVFDTAGSLFETHALNGDIAALKANKTTGNFISGRQLGVETLSAWGTAQGITTNGAGIDMSTRIAIDGDKIVFAYHTTGSLVEPNGGGSQRDTGLIVLNPDLTIHTLSQLGQTTYNAWKAIHYPAGNITSADTPQSVLVNGPGDYLVVGKTSSNMSEVKLNADIFFIRYVNGNIQNIVQYGTTTFPSATGNEEPRALIKDPQTGRIYSTGHTASPLFDTTNGILKPYLIRVNENGEFQAGAQYGIDAATDLGTTAYYGVVIDRNPVVKDGRIFLTFNHDPLNNPGLSYEGLLWNIPAP